MQFTSVFFIAGVDSVPWYIRSAGLPRFACKSCLFSTLSIRDSWLLATTYNSRSMNHVHIEPLPATLVLLSTPASGSVKPAPFRCQLGREDNVVKDDLVQDIQIKQFGIRLKGSSEERRG